MSYLLRIGTPSVLKRGAVDIMRGKLFIKPECLVCVEGYLACSACIHKMLGAVPSHYDNPQPPPHISKCPRGSKPPPDENLNLRPGKTNYFQCICLLSTYR